MLVQLPEPIQVGTVAHEAGYSQISEITRDRLVRAKSLYAPKPDQLQLSSFDHDFGFRTFKLNRSTLRVWEGNAKTLESELDLHVQNVDPSATPEDIVYELLLKAGFPLTTKVKSQEMAGKTVYSVEDGSLLICLDKEITSELIDALAEADPLQVICLDEGFKGNDQLKANAVQTFKARAASRETEIVFRTV